MTGFEQTYSAFGRLLEQELARRMAALDPESSVAKAMAYSLLGGGKRVRGVLTLACCEAVGGTAEAALPAAAAVEMLHCYSLIHDDLPCMDDDDMRRGKPACHVAFGEAVALLAGDALLTEAFLCLADISPAEAARSCVEALSAAAGPRGMVLGQELDLSYARESEQNLRRINSLKTGRLLEACALMGAACGGAGEDMAEALREYASCIGLAFQIKDDILDMTSQSALLGKPVNSDAHNGKATFASIFGLESAMQRAKELTADAESAVRTALPGDRAEFLSDLAWWLYNRDR